MRTRNTVILLVVALALLGYYWLVERPRRAAEIAAADHSLSALQPESVDRLRIERDDATLEFEIVDTHWEISAPVADVADQSAVMRFLAAIANAEVERNLGRQDDLEPFGLTTPIVVTAESPEERTVLRIGGYTIDRGFVFATIGGDQDVLMVPTAIRRYAATAVEDFRNKRVVNFDVISVDRFAVDAGGEVTWWRRLGPDRWCTVAGGDTIIGSTEGVEGILRRLRGLRVYRFPEADEAALIRERVVGGVATFGAGSDIDLGARLARVGDSAFALTVGVRPRVVEVDTSALEVLRFGVEDLREKRLLHFDRELAARIELSTPDTVATIIRAAGSWAYPNPALGAMDQRRVEAALRAAAALELDRVLSERGAGGTLGTGDTFRLAVLDDGGNIIDELLCRAAPGDSIARATSRSSRLVAEVSVAKLAALADRFRRIREP